MYFIDVDGQIAQVEWSPKRRGQLGAIVKNRDMSSIFCWDLSGDIISFPKRSPRGNYVSFAWHPVYEGSIMAVTRQIFPSCYFCNTLFLYLLF